MKIFGEHIQVRRPSSSKPHFILITPVLIVLVLLPVSFLPRKEVIHPHLPVRIPCYDLTPIAGLTLGLSKRQYVGHSQLS